MDKEWHLKHPLHPGASDEEGLRWARLHARGCGCRNVPPSVRRLAQRAPTG